MTFRLDNLLEGFTESYILTMFNTGKEYIKITQGKRHMRQSLGSLQIRNFHCPHDIYFWVSHMTILEKTLPICEINSSLSV